MQLELKWDHVKNSWYARRDGHLFVLGSHHVADATPEPREYMIVKRLGTHPRGWIVEPVTERHILVDHSGFVCEGPMCRTTAQTHTVLNHKGYPLTITPGLVHGIVRVTNNVNANWTTPLTREEAEEVRRSPDFKPENYHEIDEPLSSFFAYYKRGYTKPKPGRCYLVKGDTRACGLPDLSEVAYA